MPCILNIETSTTICSVAVSCDGSVAFNKENHEGMSHASHLGLFVQEAIAFIDNNKLTLDAVAVSCGPGSYTGLRIGVSEAKGICFGADLPLIAVNTLELMACSVLFSNMHSESDLYCPMIDARRMEVYSAIYTNALHPLKPVSADIIDEQSYTEFTNTNHVLFFGNGAIKCQELINRTNAHFVPNIHPLASHMVALSEKAFRDNNFVDVAYFEPFYLKEFVTTTPKGRI